jgi:hypothetical protein
LSESLHGGVVVVPGNHGHTTGTDAHEATTAVRGASVDPLAGLSAGQLQFGGRPDVEGFGVAHGVYYAELLGIVKWSAGRAYPTDRCGYPYTSQRRSGPFAGHCDHGSRYSWPG